MAIALLVSIINSVYINMQNQKLKNEDVQQMYSEWYAVYHMAEYVDKYINSSSDDGERYILYVNQVCHHFQISVTPSELTGNMSNLLVISYDPFFFNLANSEETLNKEKAIELLEKMNSDLLAICKDIMEMSEEEKEKLLDQSSSKYDEMNTRVKDFSIKYNKLVDDYFRTYSK